MTKVEWHVCVSVIDSVKFLAFHELLKVVLDNWALVDCSSLSSSGVNSDAVSEGEDVLESLVLESVGVHIDYSLAVGDA